MLFQTCFYYLNFIPDSSWVWCSGPAGSKKTNSTEVGAEVLKLRFCSTNFLYFCSCRSIYQHYPCLESQWLICTACVNKLYFWLMLCQSKMLFSCSLYVSSSQLNQLILIVTESKCPIKNYTNHNYVFALNKNKEGWQGRQKEMHDVTE